MSKFRDIRENIALVWGVTRQSPACALGWCARSHLTTTDAQCAAVRLGK